MGLRRPHHLFIRSHMARRLGLSHPGSPLPQRSPAAPAPVCWEGQRASEEESEDESANSGAVAA